MNRVLETILVVACCVAFAGSARSGTIIRFEGSPAIAKFIDIANNVYGKAAFMSSVITKSKGGEQCVAAGTCDIGGVANELKPATPDRGIKATLIGWDAVVVLVNRDNPVDSLSLGQLRAVFSGAVTNWKELGGPDLPVQVMITSSISATHQLFKKTVMEGAEFRAKVMEPDPTILLYVSRNKGAIGFTSFFLLDPAREVKPVKPDGKAVSPSNPQYPLSRPLYLLTREPPRPDVKEFLDWTLSDEGQSYLKTYFVGIR